MNELMSLLTKCFDVLYANKKDLSWGSKYYSRYKEEELLDQLAELEELEQMDQKRSSRLAYVSSHERCVRVGERRVWLRKDRGIQENAFRVHQ